MAKLGIPDYSTVAASNTDIDNVDCTGNTGLIRNGDNYVRSLMAHLATFYDELGGTGTVGGTANAITLTTSATAPFGSLANGNIVAFKNTVGPNTAATTINVDTLGAKAIRLQGDTALAGGELVANGVYQLRYDTAYNSAAGAWIVLNPAEVVQGTFTPGIAFGGGTTGLTYSNRVGAYAKIGPFVYVKLDVRLSAKGSSTGGATITGLPFTASGGAQATGVVAAYFNLATISFTPVFTVAAGTTTGVLQQGGAASMTNLTEANFTNTSILTLSLVYTV